MKLSGSRRLELDRDAAWGLLSDLESLGEALPAAEDLEVTGDGAFEATFRPGTSLGVTPMTMSFEVVERVAPERLVVRGSGGGPEYGLELLAAFEASAVEGATEVGWVLDLELHGVIHSLTQRVLGELAAQQIALVLDSVASARRG